MKKIVLLSLLAIGFANLVTAQVTVYASASVTIVRPLTVTKNGDLDFGTIILDPNFTSDRSVYLDPLQAAAPLYTGMIPASTAPHIAQFLISGAPNASVSISSVTPSGNPRVYAASTNPLTPNLSLQVDINCAIGAAIIPLNQQITSTLDASGNQKINVGGSVVAGALGSYDGFFTLPNAITFTINYN